MKKLVFKDVGRDKWNGSIDIQDGLSPDDIAEKAYYISKKYLATKYPETEYDADKNEGVIVAGFYTVGKFYVQ